MFILSFLHPVCTPIPIVVMVLFFTADTELVPAPRVSGHQEANILCPLSPEGSNSAPALWHGVLTCGTKIHSKEPADPLGRAIMG